MPFRPCSLSPSLTREPAEQLLTHPHPTWRRLTVQSTSDSSAGQTSQRQHDILQLFSSPLHFSRSWDAAGTGPQRLPVIQPNNNSTDRPSLARAYAPHRARGKERHVFYASRLQRLSLLAKGRPATMRTGPMLESRPSYTRVVNPR